MTVTGYPGFVPEVHDAKKVVIHGCALSKRTIAVTFGQWLEVFNTDSVEAYMPYLDGAPGKAIMVAVPGGGPVKLYPTEPAAQYRLRDQLDKTWLVGDVFVVKFSTHDVTGLDGRYQVTRVPVGRVRVNAYLPAIEWRVEKELDVREGDNTLDFELTWKRGGGDAGAPAKEGASAGRREAHPEPAGEGVEERVGFPRGGRRRVEDRACGGRPHAAGDQLREDEAGERRRRRGRRP